MAAWRKSQGMRIKDGGEVESEAGGEAVCFAR